MSAAGGQKKRVALAVALLGSPDLLVLDEPTNHMDVSMITWMEAELKREVVAVVLVTHDRTFMENCCNRILELDRGKCFMHDFGGAGSYDMFKEVRGVGTLAASGGSSMGLAPRCSSMQTMSFGQYSLVVKTSSKDNNMRNRSSSYNDKRGENGRLAYCPVTIWSLKFEHCPTAGCSPHGTGA